MKKIMLGVLVPLFIAGLLIVPINMMAVEKEDVKNGGYLGVTLSNLSRVDRNELDVDYGVLIRTVEDNGPADKAGIIEDDVVVGFGGLEVKRISSFTKMVRDQKPGNTVKVKLIRRGKNLTLKVKLGESKSRFFFRTQKDEDTFPKKRFDFEKQFKMKKRAYLGVSLHQMNKDLKKYFNQTGALILNVEEDSPAAKAGLLAGDVIVKINKKEVKEVGDVSGILKEFEPEEKISLMVIRHQKKKNLKVELGESKGFYGLQFFGEGSKNLGMMKHFDFQVPKMRGHNIYFPKGKIMHLRGHFNGIEKKIKKQLKDNKKKLKKIQKKVQTLSTI